MNDADNIRKILGGPSLYIYEHRDEILAALGRMEANHAPRPMDAEKRRLYQNIAKVALKDADDRATRAGYNGEMHDDGAKQLRVIVDAWQAGLNGAVPNRLLSYAKDAQHEDDPEYADYLRLKKKFERTGR